MFDGDGPAQIAPAFFFAPASCARRWRQRRDRGE
jgi:hypothetical protein